MPLRSFGQANQQYQVDMGYGSNGVVPDTNSLLGIGNYGVIGSDAIAEAASSVSPLVNTGGGSIWDSFLTTKLADGSTTGGYGQAGLGIASGLANAWMGMKQYGLAKDTLKANKEQFALNFGAQQKTTNNQIASVNAARAASREGAATNPYKPMELV